MKHPSPTAFTNPSPRFVNVLIVLLIGLHLILLGAGAFCTPQSLDPNPTHHSHPAAATSILCSWACHVAQTASGVSPTTQWSGLLLFFLFLALKPGSTLPETFLLHSFSPRGPPPLSSVQE